MAIDFFAHSTDQDDKQHWQLLSDHLIAVGTLASDNARYFGGNDCAKIAGRLHDVGKYTQEFQRRLEGDPARVDHATRGAIIAAERYGVMGKLLAYAIAGHHAGLANGRDAGLRTSLKDRLKKELPDLDEVWEQEVPIDASPTPPPMKPLEGQQWFQLALLGRMIFSCLVDGDFLDTEAFYVRTEKERSPRQRNFPSLSALRERLDEYLGGFNADSPVNQIRGHILAHVREQAALAPGLFSLNVPTGGGKTLNSLAFALDHAIKHGLRRVVFVIPFTSIVEQNAAVFREALGDLGDSVLEHHSAFIDDPQKSPQGPDKLNKAMENWDAPIIVTTAVQFFESLFADRPSRCRKLHNISGSVVILDEAQTLPLKLLRPCVSVIDELARNYKTSVVLCTATQPALQAKDGFKGGFQNVRELAPDPQSLHNDLKRVRVHHKGVLIDDELASAFCERDQVLCIVNNRRHARALYELVRHAPGARHLTTLMCAKHRSNTLAEIRALLDSGEPCRLISTSLIEAGVDVDFPTVFRAEAGLDSIAQAAGRCNREGRQSADDSHVNIFAVGSDWATPPELEQFAQAARSIFRRHPNDPLSLTAINEYFSELYWQKGPKQLDAHNLLGLIEEGQIDGIPYETLASKFRLIESRMLPVIIPYDAIAKKALKDLEYAEGCSQLARQLQPYIVQVPEQGFIALQKAGAIQPVNPRRFADQFMALVNMDIYHERFGLNWDDSVFIRAESSVI